MSIASLRRRGLFQQIFLLNEHSFKLSVVHIFYLLQQRLLPAHLSDARNLRMLSDVSAPHYQVIIDLWFKGDRSEGDCLGLAYFEHKVPNDLSFPAPIAKGSVYMMSGTKSVAIKAGLFKLVEDPIPPYKGVSPDRDYKPKPPKQPRCLFPEDEVQVLGFGDKDGKPASSAVSHSCPESRRELEDESKKDKPKSR